MRNSKKYKTLSSFLNVIKQVLSSNFLIKPTWETYKHCKNKKFWDQPDCDNARPIWYSSFREIVKHKRTRI